MKKLHIIIACVFAVTFIACGSGKNQKTNTEVNVGVQSTNANGDKYELYYKLEQGKTYSQAMSMDMKMTMSAMGQSMDMGMTMTYSMDMTIADVTNDIFTCSAKFTEVSMGLTSPMGNISYSSNDDSDYDPAIKMLQGMTKGQFSITMTKYGSVTSVTGFEEMMDNMYGSMGLSASEIAQAKAMMEQSFSEDKMMEQMQNMAIYPDYPVAIGDSWKMSVNTSQMEMENTYTLEGVSDDEVIIAVNSDIKAGSMEGFDGIISGTQSGTTIVHRSSGWIKSAKLKQDIAGEGKIQGMDGKVALRSDITITE